MDKIINILLLIIIFVFDPLAIALVVAANFAFNQANRKNLYGEVEADIDTDPYEYTEEDEKRMDIIGQNGNDGEHYNDPDVVNFIERADEPGPWSEEDDKIHTVGGLTNDKESGFMDFQKKMNETKVTKILQKGPSKNRVITDSGEEKWVSKNDDTITYL